MRTMAVLVFAAALLSGTAAAQTAHPRYVSTEYRFAVMFPGDPEVKDFVYANSAGDGFPARRFSVLRDQNLFTVTVADISKGPAIDWNIVEHAADDLRRKGTVRVQEYDDYDPGRPGRQLSILQSDGRQLLASIYMNDHRLYITEASGIPGTISLLQFEQSITLLNADGTEVNAGVD